MDDDLEDNTLKISVPIITNEELERFNNYLETDLDKIVNEISTYVSRDREIILLKKVIEKQSKEIEELNKENTRQHELIGNIHKKWEDKIKERGDSIDESTMLKQIKLKLQEKNIPIETLLAEFERLEDLEDDLTTVYLNGVYDGEKKVKDKIKAKIEELEKGNKNTFIRGEKILVLQSLLEKE